MALNNDFIVKSGLVVKSTTTVASLDSFVTSNVVRAPAKPSLDLNFTRSNILDSRISFNRASGATSIAADGTIKLVGINQPRFDYDIQTGQCLGLLLEPLKTNAYGYSTKEIVYYATNNFCTSTNDVKILEAGSVVNKHFRYPSLTSDNNIGYISLSLSANTVYAVSAYVWVPSATTVTSISITVDGASYTLGYADLTKRDQWQRIFTTATSNATTSRACVLRPNGMTDGGVLYSTCWQVETGTYPTSYIPTISAGVTRSADIANITGQNFYNFYTQGQGTLLIESYLPGPRTGGSGMMAALYQSSTAYIGMQYVNSLGMFTGTNYCVANGITYITLDVAGGNSNFNQINKQAITFDSTSFTSWFNGVNYSTATTFGGIPYVVQLNLGSRGGNGSDFPGQGSIRRLTYYPQKLSSEQLQVLTMRD